MILRGLSIACVLVAIPFAAAAQESKDLDRLPPETQPSTQTAAAPAGRLFLEAVDTQSLATRGDGGEVRDDRISLDWRTKAEITPSLSVSVSDRIDLLVDRSVPRGMVANDLREVYATWQTDPGEFLEVGRINLRNGVALGFNPTDFFKTGTSQPQASADPTVLREGRLGVLMLRYQKFIGDSALSLAIAPAIASRDTPRSRLDPALDRTNADPRVLLSFSTRLYDLSPQVLVLFEHGRMDLGLNLSHLVSPSVVAYAEWAGGSARDLAGDAAQRLDLSLFRAEAAAAPRFRNDLAVGMTWSNGLAKLSATIEYHYHDGGFSPDQWRAWNDAAGSHVPALREQAFAVRSFASDQQEPTARHQVFLRLSRQDLFVRDLHVDAFSFVDLYDGSTAGEVGVGYDPSARWGVGVYLDYTTGGAKSEYGSLPLGATFSAQIRRYF